MNERVKVNSFGSRDKLLQIDEETIRFNNITINRSDITGIKYWIKPIVFYHYLIGRRYHIEFRTPAGQLNIILRSYFGISNDYFDDLCDRILDEVWDPVTDRILNDNIRQLLAGKTVNYDYCELNKAGIFLPKKQQLITWDDLVYEKKYDRLVLNSISDHSIWTNLEFGKYWNLDVLIALLDWLMLEGGLKKLQQENQPPEGS